MLSRLGHRETPCNILILVWTRCEATEIGVHSVIVLSKRYSGAAWYVQIIKQPDTLYCRARPVLTRATHAPPVREGPHPAAPSGAPGAYVITGSAACGGPSPATFLLTSRMFWERDGLTRQEETASCAMGLIPHPF